MEFPCRLKYFTFCVVLSALFLLSGNLSAPADPEGKSVRSVAKPYGASSMNARLESATEGSAHLNLAAASPDEKPQCISLKPDTKITLNGALATVSDLKNGDSLELINDSDGKVTEVKATRSTSAIVLNADNQGLKCTSDYLDKFSFSTNSDTSIIINGMPAQLADLRNGDQATVVAAKDATARSITVTRKTLLESFWDNFRSNLFKPLLLFFYLGFAIAILKIPFEFPQPLYQGLIVYLLISIGWNGGEELSALSSGTMAQAIMFMVIGFITNACITVAAYFILRGIIPRMRRIDSATVAAFYGSDSAGTFVTCLGVLQAAHIAFATYMPVMLAIMEIPGCLIGLYIVSKLRKGHMDVHGNMPGESGYDLNAVPVSYAPSSSGALKNLDFYTDTTEAEHNIAEDRRELVGAGVRAQLDSSFSRETGGARTHRGADSAHGDTSYGSQFGSLNQANRRGTRFDDSNVSPSIRVRRRDGMLLVAADQEANPVMVLREVFLNPGVALLFGGIVIGFLSRSQGYNVVESDDQLFVNLFQGMLCLFLLEMGMTAAKRLQDLRNVNWRFVLFGLLSPNLFAITGMCIANVFSHVVNQPLQLGTYVLFAVLCGSASYIALPAIQRLAIPESSPALPLAASLGLTFSYNVTLGIPIYLIVAQELLKAFPVYS